MDRIFEKHGLYTTPALPYDEFRLASDVGNIILDPEKMKTVMEKAERALTQDIPFLPLSLYREFSVNGNRGNFERLYFTRRDMLIALMYAESYERKGRFTEKLADVVWAILEESTWLLPAHSYLNPIYGEPGVPKVFGDRMHGIALFGATTSADLAMAYYLCHDALDTISPTICEKILWTLDKRLVTPFLVSDFWWTGTSRRIVNNWNPWIISNALLVMGLTVRDSYRRDTFLTRAMRYLDNWIMNYPEDGGCDEGPGYFGAAGASFFDCLELIFDLTGGRASLYDDAAVRKIGEYAVVVNINGDRAVNFADNDPFCHMDGALLRRWGEKCGSESLCSLGDGYSYTGALFFTQSHMYRVLRNLMTPAVKTKPECHVKTRAYLPGLGVMTARESTDSAVGMFLAMKGGHNDESHNHNDIGNFIIYRNGNPVVIDTGVGTYTRQTFSPDRYKLWFMQSSYHNLPDIGGVAERQGRNFRASDVKYNEETGELSEELRGAYPDEAGIISYVRSGVLAGDTVTITDALSLDGEKEVDFHIMTCAAPTASGNSVSLPEGVTMTFDSSLTIEIEEFPVNDERMKKNWKSETLWRIHLRKKVKEGKFTLTFTS